MIAQALPAVLSFSPVADTAAFYAFGKQADKLADTARAASAHALSDSAVAIATEVVKSLSQKNTPELVASSLQGLRHNTAIFSAISKDVELAKSQARLFISDALWLGYSTSAKEHARAMSNDSVVVSASLTQEDRQALVVGYPILGHSIPEIVDQLAYKLRFDIDAALAMPLTGNADPAQIPVAIKAISQEHAGRVAGAVDAAYFAGVQAAVREIGRALVGDASSGKV